MLNIHGMHSARWGPSGGGRNWQRTASSGSGGSRSRQRPLTPPSRATDIHSSLTSLSSELEPSYSYYSYGYFYIFIYIYIYYTYINLYKYVHTWNIFYQIINYAQKESIFQKEELTVSSIKLLKSLVQMIFSLRCSTTQTGIASRHISKEKNSRICDEDGFKSVIPNHWFFRNWQVWVRNCISACKKGMLYEWNSEHIISVFRYTASTGSTKKLFRYYAARCDSVYSFN